jgi:hypothetical protein
MLRFTALLVCDMTGVAQAQPPDGPALIPRPVLADIARPPAGAIAPHLRIGGGRRSMPPRNTGILRSPAALRPSNIGAEFR